VAGAAEKSAGQAPFTIESPAPGTILVGPVVFRFRVSPGAPKITRIDVYGDSRLLGSAKPPSWQLATQFGTKDSPKRVVAVAYSGRTRVGLRRLESQRMDFGDEVRVVRVQLYPVVYDRHGRYVSDLTRDDFVVIDQGKPVTIDGFATRASTLSLAIVIDVSRSMLDTIGSVRSASHRFVKSLGPSDELALYAFNHALRRVVAPTMDHQAVQAGIDTLVADGGTAMYDALVRVLSDQRSIGGRKAVFLFSDGRDELSVSSLEHTVQVARNVGAIIYAVGTGEDREHRGAREDLKLLAEETGGQAYFIDEVKHLDEVFDAVLLDLRSQYMVSYPPPPGPSGLRSVEVTLASRRELRGYRVRCRHQYLYENR